MDNLIDQLKALPREILKLIIFDLMREGKVTFHELAEMQAQHLEELRRGATVEYHKLVGKIVGMYCDKKSNRAQNIKDIMHYLKDKGMVNVTHEEIDKR